MLNLEKKINIFGYDNLAPIRAHGLLRKLENARPRFKTGFEIMLCYCLQLLIRF